MIMYRRPSQREKRVKSGRSIVRLSTNNGVGPAVLRLSYIGRRDPNGRLVAKAHPDDELITKVNVALIKAAPRVANRVVVPLRG